MFVVEARDPACRARVGRIVTAHGAVETPVFMPVATQAAVKALSQEEMIRIGAEILLCNAYHLYLRPGIEVLERAGGLHRFMSWERPLLTDSGGFQVFSLGPFTKVTEEGVMFRSHIDGSRHFITPEQATDIQIATGADIIMCFDECTAYPVTYDAAAKSMRMTVNWAQRCGGRWRERGACGPALFGIVQGSIYEGLRRESAQRLAAMDLSGYAVGGVSVGESKEEMWAAAEWSLPHLPENKPRYLMGVGPPEDLLEGIQHGFDMFDCVMPTRVARNGCLFTSLGRLNIKNREFAADFGPLDANCTCAVCRMYTRAYLRHLYRSGEILALRLNTLHNLHFMLRLVFDARQAIRVGRFPEFKKSFLELYRAGGKP
jgi:queuine tRNA-ribosyltransferase